MLKIGIIQPDLYWEDISQNLDHLSSKIIRFNQKPDFILLPELFTTGFSMKTASLAEKMDGKTVRWMKEMAGITGAVIGGSIIIEDEGKYLNRFLWVCPDGQTAWYDKKHLFRMGEEDQHFTAGDSIKVMEHKSWRIRLTICYDLRFPVWCRNRGDYDLLINIANWPESRNRVWETLLQARAIENQSYVVGLNRVGKDGNQITYSGDSHVIDFKGVPLKSFPSRKEASAIVDLDLDDLRRFREKFPVYLDSDPFKLL